MLVLLQPICKLVASWPANVSYPLLQRNLRTILPRLYNRKIISTFLLITLKRQKFLDYHKQQFADTIALCPNWELIDFYVEM